MASESLPRVTEQSVQVSGQEPGFQNVDYNPEAFGSGIGRALLQTSSTLQDAARTEKFLQDQRRANDTLNVVNEGKDQLRPWLFDPQNGAFAQRGGNAQGIGAQMDSVLENIKQTQLKKLSDPKAKMAFEKMWAAEEQQTKDKVANHELDQLEAYKQNTNKGVLLQSMQDAYNYYNDPKAIDKAIKDTRVAIAANSLGMPPEMLKSAEADAISGIHLAVINRLSIEDPSKALEYLQAHDKEISGADHIQAAQFTKVGRTIMEGDRWFAERTAGGAGNQATHDLGAAVEYAETASNGKGPNQVSSAGAAGAMQLIPSTARAAAERIGRPDIAGLGDEALTKVLRSDPALNRQLGRNELGRLLKKYHGDAEAALVGYNAGDQGADDFLKANAGRQPGERTYDVPGRPKIKSETEGYVQKVLGYYNGGGNSAPAGTRMTAQNWSLRNFKPEDLTAPTPGGNWVDARAATALDSLADKMKARFPGFVVKVNEDRDPNGVTAGRRRGTADPKDNPHVSKSQHLRGDAFDVQIQDWTPEQKAAFLAEARQAGFGGIGFYGPKGHLHIDMGKPRTWGPMPAWAMNAMQIKVGRPAGGGGGLDPAGNDIASGSGGGYDTTGTRYGAASNKVALSALLGEAEGIADPAQREYVQSKIRTYAAVQEAQDKQDQAAVKQQAWDMMLGGIPMDRWPPELLSRLGREETAGLRSYAESVAKGGIATDYNRLIELKSMSQDKLAQVDINDYRPYLDQSDTKEVANLIAAARAAQNGDANAKNLMAGMRTRNEILADVGLSQGWTTKSGGDAGKQQLADFSRRLDDRIALETQATGKQLNGQQLQDIVDKMLIQDQTSTWLGRSKQGAAYQITDPDNFVAATKWSQVQPDDQKTLIDAYSKLHGGQDPNQEEAVRLYNNAMVLYLGGRPTPSNEERQMVIDALRSELNRIPKQEEVDQRYGRYLLRLLGR